MTSRLVCDNDDDGLCVLQMTLEDEEKDAMAGWRPVLASVGACACFGLIIRSLIRCHTPAFHTAFCCLTRLTRDLGRHDSHLLTCILKVRSNTLEYARIRSATLSAYRGVKTHKPWVRVNARNTCFGEHPPLGGNAKNTQKNTLLRRLDQQPSWCIVCISGASKHLLCMAGRTSTLACSLNMRGMRRIQLQLQLPSADIHLISMSILPIYL